MGAAGSRWPPFGRPVLERLVVVLDQLLKTHAHNFRKRPAALTPERLSLLS
jgi:hypothetical protein